MKTLRNNIITMTLFTGLLIAAASAAAAEEASASQDVININTATVAELETLPGIGPSKAKAIVEFRAKHPFDKVDDIMKVKGIGRKNFMKLKSNLAVSGETRISKKAPPKKQE